MSSRRRRRNRLGELLETKSIVRGPFIMLSDPTVIDLAALAGYDFVCLDAEHVVMEIVAVPGLDFVTLCPGDAARVMDLIGQSGRADLLAALDRIYAACRKAAIPTHIP